MSKLCDFSLWFSMLVAHELEEARLLNHQSRETSWTDRMLLELKRMRDPRIIAVTSNEKVTGGDMDWWFVRGSVGFCMTVQAKILHYQQSNSSLWHYEDIAHPVSNPGLQSRTLVGHARSESRAGRPRYPYYLLYNPAGALQAPHFWYPDLLAGVTVIDGYAAAGHIAHNITPGQRFPIAAKRYATLHPMMMTLHELLCAPFEEIPTPNTMVETVDAAWRSLHRREQIPTGARRRRPAVIEQLPREIVRLIDGAGTLEAADDGGGLARDTVVFLSD